MKAELHVIAEHGRYVLPLLDGPIHEFLLDTRDQDELVRAECACGSWDSGTGWVRPVHAGFLFAKHVRKVIQS